MVPKFYSFTIGLQMFFALYSVAQAGMNINPARNILWFCAFAIAVAVLYWVRDGRNYKPNKGVPSYYLQNNA